MYRIYRLKHREREREREKEREREREREKEREREREREISSCNKLNNDVPCYNLIVLFEIDLSKQIERERERVRREEERWLNGLQRERENQEIGILFIYALILSNRFK